MNDGRRIDLFFKRTTINARAFVRVPGAKTLNICGLECNARGLLILFEEASIECASRSYLTEEGCLH